MSAVALLDAFDKTHTIHWGPDLFGRGADDVDWIPQAASLMPKPIIVSGDGRILRNAVERQKLKEGDLTYVHLAPGWTNTPWNDYAWKIVKAWPRIVDAVSLIREPTVFEVSVSGLKTKKLSLTRDL